MRRSIALVLLLAACHAAPSAPPLVIDCSVSADSARCDLATLLRACQRASGRNFTWTKTMDERLTSTPFDGPAHVELPANELGAWLEATLARHGYALTPIGPKHLDVWLVDARG